MYDAIKYQDIVLWCGGGQVKVDDDTGKISWDHLRHPVDSAKLDAGDFHSAAFIQLCDAGYLYLLGDKVVMWEYPVEVLTAFDEVYVMTYLFEGSLLYYWCQYNDLEFEYVKDIPLFRTTEEAKVIARDNITVLEHSKMNTISKYKYSFSGWNKYTKINKTAMTKIESVLNDLHKNRTKGIAKSEMIFTSPSSIRERFQGRGGCLANIDWLESDCKATNDYADKRCMIYLYDKHMNPMYERYFSSKDIIIDKDLFALNSIIQWVYRGCIRKGEPMFVFIASPRMRKIFKRWLYE